MTRSPYKLLDYYRFEDADLFFGREEETREMVGEILSSRLLVLFSPSGSGKTSLINAGVRPELEKMGYKTIYTRMEDEPILSVCRAVAESLELPDCQEKEELYEYLKKAAQAAEKPLVIFLDQFEEFFIIFRNQQELRRKFIEEIARIRYDDELSISFVFSLREEYFGQFQEFREFIPSINNSSIWLQPFKDKSAYRAIEKPIKAIEWTFEEGLVNKLLKDLKRDGIGIEPIILQLVCSVLWEQRLEDSKQITFEVYKDCGGTEKILSNFIYERLKEVPHRKHKLMSQVFEALKTPDNTKRYRSFEDLQALLKIKKPQRLKPLLQELSSLDVMRQEKRGGTDWYEFKHDYVLNEINQWVNNRRERINRKRRLYVILPGLILFLSLFTYLFIQYNAFYASFSSKDYYRQQEEIVISRGIDSFEESITTGILIMDVKDLTTINNLRSKLRIGFLNKNNWDNLAETLRKDKSGEFLYKIGQKELGIKVLIQTFKDKDDDVRAQATDSLGRLGKVDNSVIEALIPALKDEDSEVQRQAADSLGRVGKATKTVIEALRQALKDKASEVRCQAADSLVRLGKVDKTVIEVLLQALKDEILPLRRKAVNTLVLLEKKDNTIIEVLLQALEDVLSYVQRREVSTLTLDRSLEEFESIKVTLFRSLKADSFALLFQAANILGKMGKADKIVIEALLQALKDGDYYIRQQAIDTLIRLGKVDKIVIEAIRRALYHEDYEVRQQAADSLLRLGKADKTAIEVLLQALKDGPPFIRQQAADSLVQVSKGNKTVIEALFQALKDDSPFVRLQAADSLVRLGKVDETVIEALLQALRDDSPFVRLHAADSLVRLGKADKIVIDGPLLALKDEYEYVREQAGKVLGNLWEKKSETELIELLKHPLSGHRTAAAYALKQKKSISQETLDEIIRLKDTDKRPWVRLGAWKAFELLQEKSVDE
ncbi:HEAT repeat domain-containing protein [Acidobacteriota bacterium]